MRLSRASLSVGHDSTMKSLQNVIEDWLANLFEDFFLSGIHLEYTIEHEADFFSLNIFDYELSVLVGAVKPCRIVSQLFRVVGSKSTEHFYIALDLLLHYNQ